MYTFAKVLIIGTLLWSALVVYFFYNSQNLKTYKEELTGDVNWATNLLRAENSVSNQLPQDNSQSTPLHKTPSPATVNILMQSNNKDLGGLIATVNSIIMNTKASVHFYFCLPEDTISHLREWLSVPELKNVKHTIKKIPDNFQHNTKLAKVMFTELFPDLHGQIIYLDSDTIVQGDIQDLLHSQILPNSYGAFSDDCHSSSVSKAIGSLRESRYGSRLNLKHHGVMHLQEVNNVIINPASCTFNTGVFVTSDVGYWRKDNISQKTWTLITGHRNESILGPQGGTDEVEAAMLAVFYKRVSPLDPLWHVRHLGVTPGSRYSSGYLSQSKLLHWSGHFKPWNRRAPEYQRWDKYFIADPTGKFRPVRKDAL